MFLVRTLLRRLTSGIVRLAIAIGALLLCFVLFVRPAFDSASEKPRRAIECAKHSHGDPKRLRRCVRKL